ncbi:MULTISPECIES: heavy metal translocating P-type ATPase [unclassified Roseitalea]|nr:MULTISPECIES: heavy metal translocating P-type ATPase [unclassified Roseitalea]
MTCCGGTIAADCATDASRTGGFARAEELLHAGRERADGTVEYVFSVPDIHCGACISAIERALKPMHGVAYARVNLSLRRVTVHIRPGETGPVEIAAALDTLGYPAQPVDLGDLDALERKRKDAELLKSLAVAGFASANIMLLSVSVWSGADGATRDLFHLISALIAVPAVIYAGRVFFRSAWGAVRRGRVNMDVPISLAIILATGMSLFEALNSGPKTYFEAATMLLFFLLIGRYLDQRMRERVRTAVVQLSRLSAKGANVVLPDGDTRYLPLDEIEPGMRVRVYAGDRLPVDGTVLSGRSDVDRALVTGESLPVQAAQGTALEAGAMNLTGVLDVTVTNAADKSFLAEVRAMMEAAENGRGAYVRAADRAARAYAPFVHSLAAIAFVMWMVITGGDWHTSLYIAIALLIITCPCALGLAVPVVHVIGASRLFESGILMRDGAALERMAEADTVVFDKTGTLTTGTPTVTGCAIGAEDEIRMARALAAASSHPASRALLRHLGTGTMARGEAVTEHPGLGMEATFGDRRARLGRSDWVAELAGRPAPAEDGLAFAVDGGELAPVSLGEDVRPGAVQAISTLHRAGIGTQILSGDAEGPVARLAAALGINAWRSGQSPADKIATVEALGDQGFKPLVVGDGINDAPALAAGHVSMAPSTGSDVGRTAADFVFTRDSLEAVTTARTIALRANALVRQNFALAFAYNLIAVPIAMAGLVTPLIAALAMSASSIVVVANSMRLTRGSVTALGSAPGRAPRHRARTVATGPLEAAE